MIFFKFIFTISEEIYLSIQTGLEKIISRKIVKMSCVLYAQDKDEINQIDLNELYEKDKKRNLNLISCFNKILNRIHTRIKLTSKTKPTDRHIFFVVPEILFGQPYYDKAHCIAYVTTQLQNNQFHTRYIHPNTLFISWRHFIPTFIRDEIRKKTGVLIDSMGKVISTKSKTESSAEDANKQADMSQQQQQQKKKYKSIEEYKPTGKLVYQSELLDQIEKHVQFESP